MTPAARLTAAAKLAREAAERATPGEWIAFRRGDPMGPFGVVAETTRDSLEVFDGAHRGNAEHCALWSPPVAFAVAAWLEEIAEQHEGVDPEDGVAYWDSCPCNDKDRALAVADALLAGADESTD